MRMPMYLATGLLLAASEATAAASPAVELVLDAKTTYQKMEGLGATVPWNPLWTRTRPKFPPRGFIAKRHEKVKGRPEPVPPKLMNRILDAAVFELGLTRLRLEVGPYMEKGNDNDDPDVANPDGFYFSWLDCCVEEVVLPIQRRIEKRGDRLVLTVSYAIENWETPRWLQQPREYFEFARTALMHLRKKYKLVPDYWVLGNESRMGHSAMPILGEWMKKNGLKTRFAFPEGVNPNVSLRYINELKQRRPPAAAFVGQVTYHIYGKSSSAQRHPLRDWARKLGVATAMTEKIGAGPEQLFLDLTEADAVAWQVYALMWFGDKPAKGTYFSIKNDLSGFVRGRQYWQLRQYFHYVRPGSVRVRVTSTDPSVKPVAFVSPKGKPIVIILNQGGARRAAIKGLPAGRYAASFSATAKPSKDLPPIQATTQPAALELPARSVLTLAGDP